MEQHECPVCEEAVVSDATSTEYCALCSMILDTKTARPVRVNDETKYFCNDTCRDKFTAFMNEKETEEHR